MKIMIGLNRKGHYQALQTRLRALQTDGLVLRFAAAGSQGQKGQNDHFNVTLAPKMK